MRHLAILALASVVQADLTCLGWGVISPWFGLVCAFKPEPFHKIDHAVASTVESAASDLEDLGEFDLTHNPAAMAFNYVETAATKGLSAANKGIKEDLHDFVDVSIGFGKQTVNQVMTLLEFTVWDDLWYCIFNGAIDTARNKTITPAGKRSTSPLKLVEAEATTVVKSCFNEKLNRLTTPLIFPNITDPNGKVGATISNIAAFLVPVGAEEKVGQVVLTEGVDLAVASAEETTRIVKWTPEAGEGASSSFASEEEALSVKTKLRDDPDWPANNCAVCNPPVPAGRRGKRNSRIHGPVMAKRGAGFSMCCKAPVVLDDSSVAETFPEEDTGPDSPIIRVPAEEGQPSVHVSPIEYKSLGEANILQESKLVPPQEYTAHEWSFNDFEEISKDITDKASAVVNWPPQLLALSKQEEFFKGLRAMFEEGPNGELWKKLEVVHTSESPNRVLSLSDDWIYKLREPLLKPYQDFVNEAVNFAKEVTARVLNLPPIDVMGRVEFFYTPPGTSETARAVVLDSHIDEGYMVFLSADQPGLVVAQSQDQSTFSRILPKPNTFQTLPAARYPVKMAMSDFWAHATPHAVFGPEILEHGRVSMAITTDLIGSYSYKRKYR